MESPMDLAYMKTIRKQLHSLGAWPYAAFGDHRRTFPLRHHLFLFCLWLASAALQLVYIRNNIDKLSFVEMGHNYIPLLVTLAASQRLIMPSMRSYGEAIKLFVSEMHLLHHKHKSKNSMKVYEKVDRICSFFCVLTHAQVMLCAIFFNVTPLIKNYRSGMYSSPRPHNGTFQQSVYLQVPFDCQHNVYGYLTMLIFNAVLTTDLAYIGGFTDIQVYVIMLHTWGHLKILEHNLRNFPRPEVRAQSGGSSCLDSPPRYSHEESDRVSQMLIQNIGHHRLLMNFVNKTSSAFGPMMCFYLAFHQTILCLLLLECSTMDPSALVDFFLMTIYVIQQLIQLSVIFELVASKGETLSDAVYSVPWECMRARERRTLLLFLANAQTSISLKAMGLVPVGVRTMAAILRTTFSYFLMLRTVNSN